MMAGKQAPESSGKQAFVASRFQARGPAVGPAVGGCVERTLTITFSDVDDGKCGCTSPNLGLIYIKYTQLSVDGDYGDTITPSETTECEADVCLYEYRESNSPPYATSESHNGDPSCDGEPQCTREAQELIARVFVNRVTNKIVRVQGFITDNQVVGGTTVLCRDNNNENLFFDSGCVDADFGDSLSNTVTCGRDSNDIPRVSNNGTAVVSESS